MKDDEIVEHKPAFAFGIKHSPYTYSGKVGYTVVVDDDDVDVDFVVFVGVAVSVDGVNFVDVINFDVVVVVCVVDFIVYIIIVFLLDKRRLLGCSQDRNLRH